MSPNVQDLVTSLGITVVPYRGGGIAMGHYNLNDNCIYINENVCDSIDMLNNTVLHEIVHWTGGDKQLKRQSLACYKSYQRYEEHLAQRAAYELAEQLGVLTPRIELFTEEYLRLYNVRGFEAELMKEDVALVLHYIENVSKNRRVA